ncbi:hypothetical protein DFH28DRAFT_1116848 [Melampsora americana]|nr:hypothetical protein DFH28DRAFT_1116848 [Melampsora americana]
MPPRLSLTSTISTTTLVIPQQRPTSTCSEDQNLPPPRSPPDDATEDGRNIIPIFTRPLGHGELEVFQALASKSGIDTVHTRMARNQAEVVGEDHKHIAQATANARILFDIANLSNMVLQLTNKVEALASAVEDLQSRPQNIDRHEMPGETWKPWEPSSELSDFLNTNTAKLVCSPTLDAYTALVEPCGKWLAYSLFNMVKQLASKQGTTWTTEHLPAVRNGVEDSTGANEFNKKLKTVCKHAREKLHLVLQTFMNDPKLGIIESKPVPDLKDLMWRVASKCGTLGNHKDEDSLWAATCDPTRARIAYLRREAAAIMKQGKGSSSIWAQADSQLAELCAKEREHPGYTVAFYEIIYNEDVEWFNGKNLFGNLCKTVKFDLPTDDVIWAAIPPADQMME